THGRRLDEACAELESVLDPAVYGPRNPQRQSVLLQAWLLALTLHEELRRRVGQVQLALPGRRMEAIGVVEKHLAANPQDPGARGLKQLLYQDLTEAEYEEYMKGHATPAEGGAPFDHEYVQQLGFALINDDTRWARGGEYLRIAAHGMPAHGPS